MKHFRILLPVLILVLLLSGCAGKNPEPYTYNVNNRTIEIYPESGTIVDGLDVYHYTRTENQSGSIDYVITYPNGGRFNWTKTQNGGHGGGNGINESLYLSGDVLVWALEAGEPVKKVGSPILGILLMGLGAVNFFFPDAMFHLRKGWMFRDAEPSDAYLTWGRISGVIIAAGGLLLCII